MNEFDKVIIAAMTRDANALLARFDEAGLTLVSLKMSMMMDVLNKVDRLPKISGIPVHAAVPVVTADIDEPMIDG
jgi:hypothetical protein